MDVVWQAERHIRPQTASPAGIRFLRLGKSDMVRLLTVIHPIWTVLAVITIRGPGLANQRPIYSGLGREMWQVILGRAISGIGGAGTITVAAVIIAGTVH